MAQVFCTFKQGRIASVGYRTTDALPYDRDLSTWVPGIRFTRPAAEAERRAASGVGQWPTLAGRRRA
jgi:hypothetical protein